MNRRGFLGMVAAVAAAAVGVVKRPKVEAYGSDVRGLPHYIYPDTSPVIFAQNDLNPDSVMSRARMFTHIPDDIQTGEVLHFYMPSQIAPSCGVKAGALVALPDGRIRRIVLTDFGGRYTYA